MMKKLRLSKQYGFTVVELMITLTIAVILISVATPSFNTAMSNSRLAAHSNDLTTALSLARLTAINRAVTVSLCSSTNQSSCRIDLNKNSWADGWIMFVDINGNGAVDSPDCTDTTKDCVLKVWGALSANAVLTGSTDFIIYNAQGGVIGAARTLTLSPKALSDCGVNQKRTISIGLSGKTTIIEDDCP